MSFITHVQICCMALRTPMDAADVFILTDNSGQDRFLFVQWESLRVHPTAQSGATDLRPPPASTSPSLVLC